MSFLDWFVLFVLIVIVVLYLKKHYTEVDYVKSSIDGRTYLVQRLPDRKEAADTLAILNRDIQKLVKHLMAKYPHKEEVRRLYENYNPDNVSEGSPFSGYTSYTINKGQKLILCIRQKDKSQTLIRDMNLLRYVVFHEAGHYASKGIGHTSEFWTNFKFILQEAVEIGLYKKTDYANNPQPYCGIKVSSSVI
jgi:hypothetical protein